MHQNGALKVEMIFQNGTFLVGEYTEYFWKNRGTPWLSKDLNHPQKIEAITLKGFKSGEMGLSIMILVVYQKGKFYIKREKSGTIFKEYSPEGDLVFRKAYLQMIF